MCSHYGPICIHIHLVFGIWFMWSARTATDVSALRLTRTATSPPRPSPNRGTAGPRGRWRRTALGTAGTEGIGSSVNDGSVTGWFGGSLELSLLSNIIPSPVHTKHLLRNHGFLSGISTQLGSFGGVFSTRGMGLLILSNPQLTIILKIHPLG